VIEIRLPFSISGAQNETSVKEFLDRFPLPVIFNALQTDPDIPGFENTLVTCLERLFKTKYGASLIPQYMPVLQVGLKADSAVVKSLACKTVSVYKSSGLCCHSVCLV
jgi:26S proteasome non-ATPase regulatory subunit 5